MANILVLDDEQVILDLLTMYISMIGHAPVGVASASELWQRIEGIQPDAIILDVMIPVESGLDICRKLRAQPRFAATPILIISAMIAPLDVEARAAGATAFLAKPLRIHDLRQALERIGVRA